jgi:glycosyltransferase involved in cell wall biosynthesis
MRPSKRYVDAGSNSCGVVPEFRMIGQVEAPVRITYVVNVDWFFLSHRLPLATAALDAGCAVSVVAADTGHAEAIRDAGMEFVPLPISRSGANPLQELKTFRFLLHHYRTQRPDLVHHVTIKPVLYGSLAARLVRGFPVVNAISGLGYLFTAAEPRLRRRLALEIYRTALNTPASVTVLQNDDDRDELVGGGIVDADRIRMIRGSGVDCARFVPTPEPPGPPVVLLPARMLFDKGVEVFVRAAEALRRDTPSTRFVLVGAPDPGNPASIDEEQIRQWVATGVVEWQGHVVDMAEAFRKAHIVVLPSRREGLPKALLEAAAAARPIVATDVPGCREIVRHEVNGLLVPPDDSTSLATAIRRLLHDRALRERYGDAGRALVVAEFSEQIVVGQTLELYRSLLGRGWPREPKRALS